MAVKMDSALEQELDSKDRARSRNNQLEEARKGEYACAPLPPGTIISVDDRNGQPARYNVDEMIAKGGFSYVYLVTKMESPVNKYILKEFYPTNSHRSLRTNRILIRYEDCAEDFSSFRKEPERVLQLLRNIEEMTDQREREVMRTRLNLVIPDTPAFQYFGEREDEGNWYFVMEKAPGVNLYQAICEWDKKGIYATMPLDKKLELVEELARAVYNLHSIGCIHKDIKPDNINVFYRHPERWDGLQLTLLDYGMATDLGLVEGGRHSATLRRCISSGYSELVFQGIDLTYFSWFNNRNFLIRNKVKLLDIYSLGKVLQLLCLTTHETLGDVSTPSVSEMDKEIRNSEYGADHYGRRLRGLKTDPLTREKLKMVLQLVKDSTATLPESRHDRFGGKEYVQVFMDRIREIRELKRNSLKIRWQSVLPALAVVAALAIGIMIGKGKRYPAQPVILTHDTLRMEAGQKCSLDMKVLPADLAESDITWSVSDDEIVSYNNRTVHALKAGHALVTASGPDGRADTCHVYVQIKDYKKLVSIRFFQENLRLKVGETVEAVLDFYPSSAEDSGFFYELTNNNIKVSRIGEVFTIKGIRPGTGDLKVRYGGSYAVCHITVEP